MMVGGMALLLVGGYDVFNQDVWSYSWIILKGDPWSLLHASMDGDDANLYRGISFMFGGVFFIFTSAFLIVMNGILGSFRSVIVGILTSKKGATRDKKVRSLNRLNLVSFKNNISEVFKRDPLVELEPDLGGSQKVVNIGEDGFTKRLKVKRPLGDELFDVVSGSLSKIRSVLFSGDPVKEVMVYKEAVRSNKSGEFERLTEWFADAQRGSEDVGDLVTRARKICKGMEDIDFSEYAAKDPINGGFIVRLVKSWADRDSADLEGQEREAVTPAGNERGRDQEVMRAAVRAMKNGENFSLDGEREVDLNEEEVMGHSSGLGGELDADDDIEDMMRKAAAGMDFSDEAEGSEETDSAIYVAEKKVEDFHDTNPDSAINMADEETSEIVNIISEMSSFAFLSNAVSSGVDEWPEDLASEEQRREHITSISSMFVSMGMVLGEDVLDLAERLKDEFAEFEWLIENRKIVEEGFVKFIESLSFGDEEGSEENPDPSDISFEEAAGGIDAQEEEIGEVGRISGDGSDEESVSLTDESSMEDDLSDIQSDHITAEAGEMPLVSSAGSSGINEAQVETKENYIEENSEDVVEVVKREPVDLSIPELSEVPEAGGLPIIWGKTCRLAGATEASVGKFVFEKVDDTFQPVGVVHLVAVWKNHDTATRLNVIFKKVPKGNWSLKLAGSVRMERDDGDFVEVSGKFLNHKEMKESKTIIHFYGEGIEWFDSVRMGDNVMVISKIFDVEGVRDFIKG
jgi:hypothetical protein